MRSRPPLLTAAVASVWLPSALSARRILWEANEYLPVSLREAITLSDSNSAKMRRRIIVLAQVLPRPSRIAAANLTGKRRIASCYGRRSVQIARCARSEMALYGAPEAKR